MNQVALLLLSLFFFTLTSAVPSPPPSNISTATCPLDLDYILRIQWNTTHCKELFASTTSQNQSNRTLCCQDLLSLYGIALAQRLKDTSLFELPDLPTSISCLQDFQSKLTSLSLTTNLVSSCFTPQQFVISPNICARIVSTQDWVAKLGPSTSLDSACRPDLTDLTSCGGCVEAGTRTQRDLIAIDGNTSRALDCWHLTILYAAGIVNEFGPKSQGAMECIFGLSLNSQAGSGSKSRSGLVFGLTGAGVAVLVMSCLLVARCQSFAERAHAHPLPLPGVHSACIGRTDSGISISIKPRLEEASKPSLLLPLPRPGCIHGRPNPVDLDGDVVNASVFSESSVDSDDLADSHHRSPQATDCDTGTRGSAGSPSSLKHKDQSSTVAQMNSREGKKPPNRPFSNLSSPTSPKKRPLSSHVPNLQGPYIGAFFSAPDSSMSSPSRSPVRASGCDQGQNSGQNSMSGQIFWQQSRGSPEYSPVRSPRMTSPGPSSRIHSGAVTPTHPRAGGTSTDSQMSWPDDAKQKSHRLPLPPITISNTSPFSHSNSAATSPSVPRSPGRAENPASPGSRWKKGKLLGRGTFGHVYVGFNSESGEMCAMKEVTLFSDDAKSKESAKQLMQEIALLSRLRHPNIVQYYGTETVGDKLYIYLEYVSGGSIFKLLQDYGQFGELAIRSYTHQILSGLAYLHAKNTVHRDIKGANILVDPVGRVKLADFGMAKHIAGQSCPLSFKGSPYWMAPEVIKTSNGCNLAVDIWSLGCTVLEMATTKPPWSQYEGVAAMFKIGNSKELPAIPEHLSRDGKDFVWQCLQRNPIDRPKAAELLEHPFVKYVAPLERPILSPDPSSPPAGVTNGVKALGIGQARNLSTLDSDRLAFHSSRVPKTGSRVSEIHIPRNISCPVSPIGSPLLHSRSPHHLNERMSPSPISSPRTTSGSSTPLTGGGSGIPFNQLKQSVYLPEDFGSMQKPPNGFCITVPSYHESNPDIFKGMQTEPYIFSELVPSENGVLGKQFGRPAHGELYDGQSVLADRVSRQLLSPSSPLSSRTNGI